MAPPNNNHVNEGGMSGEYMRHEEFNDVGSGKSPKAGKSSKAGKSKDGARDNSKYNNDLDAVSGYETWNSMQLANYFAKHGLGEYHEVLTMHKITGKIAPLLTDTDLKDMGINIVGDRCRFRLQIDALSRKARAITRTQVMWESQERLFFSCCDACLGTCCGACPEDPSTYKLTQSHLKVRLVTPQRCGPITCCCCTSYAVNNIDLTNVDDVDMVSIPAPFMQQVLCCGEGKDIVDVNTTNEGKIYLTLKMGDGEYASQVILNQIEESQVMERD